MTRRRIGLIAGAAAAVLVTAGFALTLPSADAAVAPAPGGGKVMAYFADWTIYARNYFVKNIQTSGSASKLNYINYAFGNVVNGQCAIGDAWADYQKPFDAATSVDGKADPQTGLLGNFNQLKKLKKMHPGLKVIYSFGGWTWSGGFTQAAKNPKAFADSCYKLVNNAQWAGVFDGIDLDWEYPNACGLGCDSSGANAFANLMAAIRARFGGQLVTAAITADASTGGKMDLTNYGAAAKSVNWFNVMTYDFFGAWAPSGPTAPHSPLRSYTGIPIQKFDASDAIAKLKSKGVPGSKMLLGVGLYGRGWAGVKQKTPGGTASGPAPGTYEAGVEDYKVLKSKCPANGMVAGTAYCFKGGQWWSYDTPTTIAGKMGYAKSQGLAGAFAWELSGDSNGELIGAIRSHI
jgi:chitinase